MAGLGRRMAASWRPVPHRITQRPEPFEGGVVDEEIVEINVATSVGGNYRRWSLYLRFFRASSFACRCRF